MTAVSLLVICFGERIFVLPSVRQGKHFAEELFYLLQRQALSFSQSQEGKQMVTCFRQ